MQKQLILGIETSCDETAAAIVSNHKKIIAHRVYTQLEDHIPHGGVVPEIAARAHVEKISPVVEACVKEAKISISEIDAIAATCGPGLIGGVMVGMVYAKSLAATLNKPFIAINHLAAHVLTPRLTFDIQFPYLCLLVSGGHTQFLLVKNAQEMETLGQTLDDALGECFDKSAKMMGLPYPGGPQIEKLASKCIEKESALEKFQLPRPLLGKDGCDFSFSGLKTAMRQYIENFQEGAIPETEASQLAYAFQIAITDTLTDRCKNAIMMAKDMSGIDVKSLAIVGGVAANQFIAKTFKSFTDSQHIQLYVPPPALCTDNGAMIAWAGQEKLALGLTDTLDFKATPRWPLGKVADNI